MHLLLYAGQLVVAAVMLGCLTYGLFCVPTAGPADAPRPLAALRRAAQGAGVLWLGILLTAVVTDVHPRAGWIVAALLLLVSLGFTFASLHWNNRFASFGFALLALSVGPFVGALNGQTNEDLLVNGAFFATVGAVVGLGTLLAAGIARILGHASRGAVADDLRPRRLRITLLVPALSLLYGLAVLVPLGAPFGDWWGVGLHGPGPDPARMAPPGSHVTAMGFTLDGPFDYAVRIFHGRFDTVWSLVAILAIAFYALGVRTLTRRGDEWSRWRTLSWMSGAILLLFVTAGGINRWSYGQFSVHIVLHMALNLYIPALLVLGGPVTLFLRAVHSSQVPVPRDLRASAPQGTVLARHISGPREWVLSLVHSRYVTILSHSLVAIVLYIVTLYGIYFTPFFDPLISHQWGHVWMNVHFFLSGYLFYWPIVGIDPGAKRLPHLGRLGMLMVVMPFHAFYGVALMMGYQVLGADYYLGIGLFDSLVGLRSDQTVGGGIAWISGEIPLFAVVVSLGMQWWRSDRSRARSADHRADFDDDAELDAYNEMLRTMAEQRR